MNRRKDRYGGILEKRMAFPAKIVQWIRRAARRHFPILFRVSADDFERRGCV
jgi:2,4-dienoyl-CoA reductase-like NADH-dependent reductase (Old Yellow Enzyme family)